MNGNVMIRMRFVGQRLSLDQQASSASAPGGSASRPTMTISGTAIGVIRSSVDMDHGRRRAVDQPDEAAELGHPRAGVVPGGAQQQMLGLVAAQHVVDEVGREADLAPGLALAGMLALDQPADHRHLAEGALEQNGSARPIRRIRCSRMSGENSACGSRIGSSP